MINEAYYLDIFHKAAGKLDKNALHQQGLAVKVGVWIDSVVLKIQKPNWINPSDAKPFGNGIFFSIWVSDHTINNKRIYYNIHALKLRELKAYKIQSRQFAEVFRLQFKPIEKQWPNVSINFGPLTLMEGWIELDTSNMVNEITRLANNFIPISPIINDLLNETK